MALQLWQAIECGQANVEPLFARFEIITATVCVECALLEEDIGLTRSIVLRVLFKTTFILDRLLSTRSRHSNRGEVEL